MSYCRFTSDDGMSEVYVYPTDGGIVTSVARNRRNVTEELPPPIDPREDPDGYADRFIKVMEIRKASPLEPIGLPYDGEDFTDPTPAAAADRLEHLRGLGYHVPQRAIDALRAEAEEAT